MAHCSNRGTPHSSHIPHDTQVTVVARATPDPKHMDADPHYTSREAGAVWSSFAGEHELDQQRWEAVSFRALLSLSKYPETGVRRIPSAHLYDSEARPDVRLRGDAPVSAAAATATRAATATTKPALATPWYSSFVPDFRPLTAHELPKGMVHGYHFTTVTVNPIKYLRWLMDQFETMGGAVKVRTLRHLAEAVHVGDVPSTVVVNCTGYGARTLGGVMDRNVYATRGQTILIKASPSDDSVVMVEDPRVPNLASYIIPRDDGTVILGGTYEPHNANVVPHPETAKGIMERCRAISPSLAKMGESIHVLRHGVYAGVARDARELSDVSSLAAHIPHTLLHAEASDRRVPEACASRRKHASSTIAPCRSFTTTAMARGGTRHRGARVSMQLIWLSNMCVKWSARRKC